MKKKKIVTVIAVVAMFGVLVAGPLMSYFSTKITDINGSATIGSLGLTAELTEKTKNATTAKTPIQPGDADTYYPYEYKITKDGNVKADVAEVTSVVLTTTSDTGFADTDKTLVKLVDSSDAEYDTTNKAVVISTDKKTMTITYMKSDVTGTFATTERDYKVALDGNAGDAFEGASVAVNTTIYGAQHVDGDNANTITFSTTDGTVTAAGTWQSAGLFA